MNIKLGTTVLADATDSGGHVSDFRIVTERQVQIGQYIEAASSQPIPRKQELNTVSFEVTRLHASILAAEKFVLEHARDLPYESILRLTATDMSLDSAGGLPTPGQQLHRYLYASEVRVADATYIGATTFLKYTILGGSIVDSEGATP